MDDDKNYIALNYINTKYLKDGAGYILYMGVYKVYMMYSKAEDEKDENDRLEIIKIQREQADEN